MMSSVLGEAIFDSSMTYRYQLTRNWNTLVSTKGIITWVMMNPSTADQFQDDPTIRRCISFSKNWGYSGLIITNIYAFRSTDPKGLLKVGDPMGPDNPTYIKDALDKSSSIVVAWGSFIDPPTPVREVLKDYSLFCLGTTKHGHPKHPLYIKGDTIPIRFHL